MLVTARQADYPLQERGGCLLRLSSNNLMDWREEGPLLFPGGVEDAAGIPECPDYFVWNGWHYLLFGLGLATHYRMARSAVGPWRRPRQPLLDSRLLAVMKTAPFGAERRIGAAWIGARKEDLDNGSMLWGGNLVLRELVQHADGALSTRFVPEFAPKDEPGVAGRLCALTSGVEGDATAVTLHAPNGQAVAALDELPPDFTVSCRVLPQGDNARFGLGLRGEGAFRSFAPLAFEPGAGVVTLADHSLLNVQEIGTPFDLLAVCRGDIIDVCVGDARCLINRLPQKCGDRFFWFCEGGEVRFEEIRIVPWG